MIESLGKSGYFYEVDAWLPRNYVMVNSDVWSGTSDANKNVIRGCNSC